ncbi:MAG: hypothetical protein HJJLKODD_02514 [Phycisphaerae bacterium]|nr:hypothetical protein [Phycisphaerae bacterium]
MKLLKRSVWLMLLVTSCLMTPAAMADEALPQDPNNVYGQLDNGMHYIIRKNVNPPGRVAMYIHIKTGALNETDQQNGMAHFLEHLAFNGSKNYPPGQLIPLLNQLGMNFGQHTNAHTSFKETVYKLTMPDNKNETVDLAMKIFADWAEGMLLQPAEIDKERGVILEESRSRKSAGQRLFDQWRKEVLVGSRFAIHDVIGDEAQIAKWQQAEFQDYYNTWYRPEAMTVIVVGEIDPAPVAESIKSHLSGIKARAASRTPMGGEIKPVEQTRAFVMTDPEQVMGEVELQIIRGPRPPIKTYKDFRFNEVENIGTWIVSRRLREMVDNGTAKFRFAGAGVSSFMDEAIMPQASATGEPADWSAMLDQLVTELNRAITHGFTPAELELCKKETLADAEKFVQSEATLDANQFLGMISGAIGSDEPLLSAQQRLDLLKRVYGEVTLAEANQVFIENFKTPHYNYVITLPEKKAGLTNPTTEEVLAAAKSAWEKTPAAPKAEELASAILEKLPEPGQVVEQSTDADLQITTLKLSNGVVVHYRFMDYKKDNVWVSIVLPGGVIEETPETKGVSAAASTALQKPATSRLTSTQIRDLMTGKKVDVGGGIGLDALVINVSGSPSDLEPGLQLAYALLTDARVEKANFDNFVKLTRQQLQMLETLPQGHLQKAMDELLYAGDIRMSLIKPEQLDQLSVEKAQNWLQHITSQAAIEVAVVGDMPLDQVTPLLTRYLGGLPQRSLGYEGLDSLRQLKRNPGPYARTTEFTTTTPKAMVLAGFVGCNYTDVFDRRALNLISQIVSDRMIKKIREEEQLVYSIRCVSVPAEEIPGLGMVFSQTPTDPQNGTKLANLIVEMMKDFAATGPTEEELATAKKQLANLLDTSTKEPGFWLNRLSSLEYHKRSLQELKELKTAYEPYTIAQLKEVAGKYFVDERMFNFVATPKGQSAAPADAPSPAPAN